MEREPLKKLRRRVTAEAEFLLLLKIAEGLQAEIYLVGGLVRDAFLGRDTADADLILSRRSLEGASQFARATGGTLVLLREIGGMARVVVKERTFDFAEYRGQDLPSDLAARDFTVNAVALPLAEAFGEGPWSPIDPLGGIKDIRSRTLRMTSDRALLEDPLRLLRAFRLSAQLDLDIEPHTLEAVETYARLLPRCAPERIHQEWLILLSQDRSYSQLQGMDRTGLLAVLFPELTRLKGLIQDKHHHLDAFDHSLLTVHILEAFFQRPESLPAGWSKDCSPFFHEKKKKAWLKEAALFHDLGKADTFVEKGDGRRTFFGHARASEENFLTVAERLRMGNAERDFVVKMLGNHMRPLYLAREKAEGTLTRRALLRLLRDMHEDLAPLFLLALADDQAAQGPEKSPTQTEDLLAVLRQALALKEEVLRPIEENPPLLRGKDLIALGLKPGPLFGRLLAELKEERLEGRIKNREEAWTWIKAKVKDLGLFPQTSGPGRKPA